MGRLYFCEKKGTDLYFCHWQKNKSVPFFSSVPFFVLLFLSFHISCAPAVQQYTQVDNFLVQGKYPEADNVIEKHKKGYGRRNEVLYYLDRAMTLHLSGRYAESNTYLEKGEVTMEDLYTRSITSEAGAMLTNDNLLPYGGEDFEKVMINVMAALNYVYLNKWDDALVEARKIDHKLNLYNDKYVEKNVYKEDAFARYLTGILYEAKGELNDAFIAYRRAYETYMDYKKEYGTPMPPTLPGDLIRITGAMHFDEEHRSYRRLFPDAEWISHEDLAGHGEVFFFSYDGRAPVKVDFFIDAPVPDGRGGIYYLRVALPRFAPQPFSLGYVDARLISSGGIGTSQRMFLGEDIASIAVKNLEDRIGRVTTKAVARVTAKYMASLELRKRAKNDPLASLLVNIGTNLYSIISEEADKRSWRTLPAQIRMARLAAPPGQYTLSVDYYTSSHRLITRKSYPVNIRAGEKIFLSNRYLSLH